MLSFKAGKGGSVALGAGRADSFQRLVLLFDPGCRDQPNSNVVTPNTRSIGTAGACPVYMRAVSNTFCIP